MQIFKLIPILVCAVFSIVSIMLIYLIVKKVQSKHKKPIMTFDYLLLEVKRQIGEIIEVENSSIEEECNELAKNKMNLARALNESVYGVNSNN